MFVEIYYTLLSQLPTQVIPLEIFVVLGYPAFSTHHHLHPEKAGESHSILTKTFQTLTLEPGILNQPQISSLLWVVVTKMKIWNNTTRYKMVSFTQHCTD